MHYLSYNPESFTLYNKIKYLLFVNIFLDKAWLVFNFKGFVLNFDDYDSMFKGLQKVVWFLFLINLILKIVVKVLLIRNKVGVIVVSTDDTEINSTSENALNKERDSENNRYTI